MTNSVDPEQTAAIGAVCSGSTLFASMLNLSVMLGNYFYPIFCAHLIIFIIITSTPTLECLHCVVCVKSVIQTDFIPLHNDCSHIEDVHRRCRSRAESGLV